LELVGTFALRGLERKQQIWAPFRSPHFAVEDCQPGIAEKTIAFHKRL